MARPSNTQPVDLSQAINLTVGTIERLACPPGKSQAFLRDAATPGLRVRVSATGAKTFVVERKQGERTVRRAIGDVRTWSIEKARDEARRVYTLLSQGVAPENLQPAVAVAEPSAQATSVSSAWAAYLADRKTQWGDRHYADHAALVDGGGVKYKRGKGVTKPGVLHPLMHRNLSDLSQPVIESWASTQAASRATQARLGLRMLSAFLNWCSEQPEFKGAVPGGYAAVKSRRARESLGKAGAKKDALMREQLPAWFAAVATLHNKTIAAYLQTMLLTGARPSEVRWMKWADVDWAWRGITIHDKVEGLRVIPLTPYVASLLRTLPRRNAYVFASGAPDVPVISSPNDAHHAVCAVAGIAPLTLHALRRSFRSLTEWLDMPTGAVAQIMGHKPSATAEKHYTVRPLDLLRLHHERVEAWVLEQAGVQFEVQAAPGRLVIAK